MKRDKVRIVFLEEARVRKQSDLVYALAQELSKSNKKHLSVLFPLLDGIIESVESLLILVRHEKIPDLYAISRMVYETALNACFIAARGDSAAERALRHAHQKSFRDLNRSITIGKRVVTLASDAAKKMDDDPEVKALLAEFTTTKGREMREWTPENIEQRLDAIVEVFGHDEAVGLGFGQLLYRHSSEFLHGTLFAQLFSYGAMTPGKFPKTPGHLRAFRIEQTRLIFLLLSTSLDSMIRILAAATNRQDLIDKARRAYDQKPISRRKLQRLAKTILR